MEDGPTNPLAQITPHRLHALQALATIWAATKNDYCYALRYSVPI